MKCLRALASSTTAASVLLLLATGITTVDGRTKQVDGGYYDGESSKSEQEKGDAGVDRVSTSGSSVGSGRIEHRITVGREDGAAVFEPDSVSAAVGELVQFVFVSSKNFSVVEARFDRPCVPTGKSSSKSVRPIYSGFRQKSNQVGQKETFTVEIEDEKPIWFYSSSGTDCQYGMVGVINAPESTDQTVERFRVQAKEAQSNESPSTGQSASLEVDREHMFADGPSGGQDGHGDAGVDGDGDGGEKADIGPVTNSSTGAGGFGINSTAAIAFPVDMMNRAMGSRSGQISALVVVLVWMAGWV